MSDVKEYSQQAIIDAFNEWRTGKIMDWTAHDIVKAYFYACRTLDKDYARAVQSIWARLEREVTGEKPRKPSLFPPDPSDIPFSERMK